MLSTGVGPVVGHEPATRGSPISPTGRARACRAEPGESGRGEPRATEGLPVDASSTSPTTPPEQRHGHPATSTRSCRRDPGSPTGRDIPRLLQAHVERSSCATAPTAYRTPRRSVPVSFVPPEARSASDIAAGEYRAVALDPEAGTLEIGALVNCQHARSLPRSIASAISSWLVSCDLRWSSIEIAWRRW
jgi:hypothetical protein